MKLKNVTLDEMVVTSSYVIEDKQPILYVSNDNDEEGGSTWQFHCDNGDFDMKKMLLVRLSTILEIDKGLSDLILNIGEEARRESNSSKWVVKQQE